MRLIVGYQGDERVGTEGRVKAVLDWVARINIAKQSQLHFAIRLAHFALYLQANACKCCGVKCQEQIRYFALNFVTVKPTCL